MTLNVITIKWGRRYGPEYVNRLYSGVKRNLMKEFKFVCFTDNAEGIRSEIETHPIPESVDKKAISHFSHGKKQHLFQSGIGGLEGTCLYFDLDVIIVGSLDCFVDYKPGHFCICKEWLPITQILRNKFTGKKFGGNSSIFRFEANSMQFVVDRLNEDPEITKRFRLEQYWLSHILQDQMNWWPSQWLTSFKHRRPFYPLSLLISPLLPSAARVVVFNGPLKPSDAVNGRFDWNPRRFCRPAKWAARNWID